MASLIQRIGKILSREEIKGLKELSDSISDEDLARLREVHDSFRRAAISKAEAEGHLNSLMEEVLDRATGGAKHA